MIEVGTSLAPLLDELVAANRILANEGVLDAFGHVSTRHPDDPAHYLLSRSRSPGMVERCDIRAFDLDSNPAQDDGVAHYVERVIHGCIFRARPDVRACCHFHAPAMLPFANTGVAMQPVLHVGALIGQAVPMWDVRAEFGDTDMLVSTLAQGHSLARGLGCHWSVVMRRHGAVVVGRTLRELVFRAIVLMLNAEVQLSAMSIGTLSPLTAAEVELSAAINLRPSVQQRVWEYWSSRLPDRGARAQPAGTAGMTAAIGAGDHA